MSTRFESADHELLARLSAPANLDDGMESLGYWRGRSKRLPWYRFRARREASEMTLRWEQRVGAALIAQRGAPPALRLSAAMLLARTRVGRWVRRARVVALVAGTFAFALVAIPTFAALALLLYAL